MNRRDNARQLKSNTYLSAIWSILVHVTRVRRSLPVTTFDSTGWTSLNAVPPELGFPPVYLLSSGCLAKRMLTVLLHRLVLRPSMPKAAIGTS